MSGNSREYEGRFDVDTTGFKNQMAEMHPYRLVQELIANGFDEDSISNIDCYVTWNEKSRLVDILVTDNGDGFRSIQDVFNLFRRSYKRGIPTKSGRFNLGEKEFMAVAVKGHVRSRDWKVEFYDDKRKEITDMIIFDGTSVFGSFKWYRKNVKEIISELNKLIVPQGKQFFINRIEVEKKPIIRTINGKLRTEIEDDDTQQMVSRIRETTVDIYPKKEDEVAWIFELGVPVQQFERTLNMQWHVDVRQKVPLGIKRDIISDAYLIDIYALLVNNCHDLIHKEDAGAKWINRSMSKVDAEPAKEILKKQYGTDKIYVPTDTSDYHANEAVNLIGGKFVYPRTLDKDEKKHLKDIGVLKYALEEFGSGLSREYKVIEPTEKMLHYFKVVKAIAFKVIKKKISVSICDSDITHPAWYDGDSITYNIRYLPKKKQFFDSFTEYGLGLLCHELSHDKVPDEREEYPMPHSSKEFLSEFERISGILAMADINEIIYDADPHYNPDGVKIET